MRESPPPSQRDQFAQRDLFASSHPPVVADDGRSDGARIGVSLWFITAVALVVGIVIGFASGYSAGMKADGILDASASGTVAAPPATDDTPPPSTPEATFTEGTVSEPARVDPEPIVAAPPPPPAAEPPPARERPAVAAPRQTRAAPVDPAASGPGSLQIVSRPAGATVFVDGQTVGRTPMVISNVRSGAHDVRLEMAGFRRWATSVQVSPGARARVAASLEQ
jgi:hypothetical protein